MDSLIVLMILALIVSIIAIAFLLWVIPKCYCLNAQGYEMFLWWWDCPPCGV